MSHELTRSLVLESGSETRLRVQASILRVHEGPDVGLEYRLEDRPVVVGRGETADLRLGDATVSREHVRIQPCEDGWRILDLGSKSGTRLGDARIESARLEDGSRIRIGATLLVLRTRTAEFEAPACEAPAGLIGRSPAMRRLLGLIEKVAPLGLPALLLGESGTGKERLARRIHERSAVADGPYEVVDCTLLGDGEHLRSELFGHVRGAFTGADRDRQGAFARAHGGTLFLDEVGEIPLALQPQLLRVLEEGEVRPLGGSQATRVRVRIVAATHKDLPALVEAGSFRRDLYYRLSAVTLPIPPLRDRDDDALVLAETFLAPGLRLTEGARRAMLLHRWPGNVRELRHSLERASALAENGRITAADLGLPEPNPSPGGPEAPEVDPGPRAATADEPDDAATPAPEGGSLRDYEERAILDALRRFDGNRNKAAEFLGMGRATLFRKLKRMGIT